MAVNKELLIKGVPVTYWVATDSLWKGLQKTITVYMYGYLNETHFINDPNNYIDVQAVTTSSEDTESVTKNDLYLIATSVPSSPFYVEPVIPV